MNPQTTPRSSSQASPEFRARVHLGQPWCSHWRRFERNMHKLGLEIHECAGPGGWGGPAVTIPLAMLDRIIGATRVKLDHHAEAGDHVMLYPAPVWI